MVHDAININGSLFSLDHPRVMAIINATPDSFAFSCTNIAEADFLAAAGLALNQGADILDIGAYSTRPGAVAVDESEEWRRLEIALSAIQKAFPDAVLSVDTFRSLCIGKLFPYQKQQPMKEPNRILFIEQEIYPYLADETPIRMLNRQLPEYFQANGYETRTFMPKFGEINERRNQLHEVIRLSGMNLIIDDADHPLLIKVAR